MRFHRKRLVRSGGVGGILFVVVGCKLSKRHYFLGLCSDMEAAFLNFIFYFSIRFFSSSREGFEVDFQNLKVSNELIKALDVRGSSLHEERDKCYLIPGVNNI